MFWWAALRLARPTGLFMISGCPGGTRTTALEYETPCQVKGPMRLLVVEDEKKVSSFIRKGLEEEGYAVDVAFDGKTGLEMAMDEVHDLIVLDIHLPGMDGLSVLARAAQGKSVNPGAAAHGKSKH